jgi:hypothetical protein
MLPAGMLEAFLIWELFNATKRDMVEAPCFDDTRNPTPVMLYLSEEKRNAHRGVIQQLNRSATRSAPKAAIPQVEEFGVPDGI